MNEHRRQRIAQVCEKHQVDALVASAPENVHYVTGYRSIGQQILRTAVALAVVLPSGELGGLVLSCADVGSFLAAGFDPARVVAYGRFFFEGGEAARTVQELTAAPQPGPAEALAMLLQRLGLDRARLGVDEGQLPLAAWQALPGLLPAATVLPGNALLREARMVKDAGEVTLLERAAEIAEDALQAAVGQAGPGITERELAGLYEREVATRGGTPFFSVVTFGERAALVDVPASDRALRSGDVLRFDFGCVYRGYRSDLARTAACGDVDERFRRYYAAMLAGEDAAIAAARPGVAAEEVFRVTMEVVRAHGVPHYRRQHVGHGIGLEVYDVPSVAPGVTVPLQEGMVLCLETPYYELGWGGVQVEDMVALTGAGARLLNKTSRDLWRTGK